MGAGALPQTLVCPRLSTACPELFCPFSCAGRGVCNFATTVNGTIHPTCECFDPEDTSPGCSDSLLPDGGFLENSDGLFDNVEEDFFDPLIAVFVDHPDKWTTSSWAWAAGLLTVFLIMLLCICSAFWPTAPKKSVSSQRGSSQPRTPSRSRESPRSSEGDRGQSSAVPRASRTSGSSMNKGRRSLGESSGRRGSGDHAPRLLVPKPTEY